MVERYSPTTGNASFQVMALIMCRNDLAPLARHPAEPFVRRARDEYEWEQSSNPGAPWKSSCVVPQTRSLK